MSMTIYFFEALNLKGMVKLWGRKVHDLALAEFLDILQWVAIKKDKVVSLVRRWYPSSNEQTLFGVYN